MKLERKFILISIFLVGLILLLNINVTTQQGVNYQVREIRTPLFLKLLNFIDRHYNYKYLVKDIIKDVERDEEKAMKIFEWAYKNIRKSPEGFLIIDDHAWHIIIRGYGINDQVCDVFTTLCNYAGLDALFLWIQSKDSVKSIPFSFVKLQEKWYIFDPYNGVYFKDKNSEFIDIEKIKSGSEWRIETIEEKPDLNYAHYLTNLPDIKGVGLQRANIQSPIKRFIFEVKKWTK